MQHNPSDCLSVYQSMVTIPQSINASIDTVSGYFNAYLMHKMYIEYLVVNLSAVGLLSKEWVKPSTASSVHNNLNELLIVLKYNVDNFIQLVSNS